MKNTPDKNQVVRAISIVQQKIKFLGIDISKLQSLHNPIGRPNAGKVNAALMNLKVVTQNVDIIISYALQQLKKEEEIYTCFFCKDEDKHLTLEDLIERDKLIEIVSN